ncbi:MAG: hypothetical protein F4W92_08515 [Gammaproteobacteria bacterium]|nr:hypothetical protein [Gammaproteobacteria bacterium]
MFNVLFRNQVKLIAQQSLYWGTALVLILLALALYNLYFVDQATTFWDGETSPPARYMIIYLGGIPLVLMMLVSCFISTRTYSKESHVKIQEVLFTKPFGNLVHALSSTLATTLFCTLPIVGFIACVYVGSFAQNWFNADVFEPFELASTCMFLVFTTFVSLYFVSLLSYYVYYAIRIPILSVLASTAITVGIIYLLTRVTFNQFVLYKFLPLVGDVASDMVADNFDILDYSRFFAFICLCATLVVGATWILSRWDQRETSRILLSGFLGAITCIGFAILFLSWFNQNSNIQKWQQHAIEAKDGITLDVQMVSGSVVIEPGKNIEANITITGTLDDNIGVDDQLLFWLNPGFKVHGVQLDDREVQFDVDASKLLVNLSNEKTKDELVEMTIKYRGRPNTRYGYQDTSLDIANTPYWDQLISYFGMSPGIFDRKYVALPYATHWLPTSSLRTKNGASSADFVEADLSITIPADWLVFLSGSTLEEVQPTDINKRTVRVATQHPLAGLSLYASDLTKYSTELDSVDVDVTLELYASDRHISMLREKADYETYLQIFETWFVESLTTAQDLGQSFPCDTFRLVAVPSDLRVYNGGIFLDSLITQPCTYLLREHGLFATTNYRVIGGGDSTWAYRSQLEGYFGTRHNGENLVQDLPNHYFEFQTGFLGLEGSLFKKVLSYLHNHAWSRIAPNPSAYSSSIFFPSAMNIKQLSPKAEYRARIHSMPMDEEMRTSIVNSEVSLREGLTYYVKRYIRHIDQTDYVFQHFLESDAVLNIAIRYSLQELASLEPSAIVQEAIRLRCMALAEKLYRGLGRANSRVFLQEISNNFRHQNVSVSDVFDIAESLELPVKEIVAGWFDQTDQFNFSFSSATVSKHVNPDTQENYYQVRFAVVNEGKTAGVFRSSLRVAPDATEYLSASNPEEQRRLGLSNLSNAGFGSGPSFVIPTGSTREVGITSTTLPYRINLTSSDVSYVNAVSLIVRPDPSVIESTEQAPFVGTGPSTWAPDPMLGVIIDDTDLISQPEDDGVITYDKNVERFDFGGAYGSARKSFIYTEHLKSARVNVEAELPTRDSWQIEIHVPDIRGAYNIGHRQRRMMVAGRTYFKGKFEGEYEAIISSGGNEVNLEFEIADSDYGWVRIGVAELDSGPTAISIVPKSGTEQLFFDALRFVQSTEK